MALRVTRCVSCQPSAYCLHSQLLSIFPGAEFMSRLIQAFKYALGHVPAVSCTTYVCSCKQAKRCRPSEDRGLSLHSPANLHLSTRAAPTGALSQVEAAPCRHSPCLTMPCLSMHAPTRALVPTVNIYKAHLTRCCVRTFSANVYPVCTIRRSCCVRKGH